MKDFEKHPVGMKWLLRSWNCAMASSLSLHHPFWCRDEKMVKQLTWLFIRSAGFRLAWFINFLRAEICWFAFLWNVLCELICMYSCTESLTVLQQFAFMPCTHSLVVETMIKGDKFLLDTITIHVTEAAQQYNHAEIKPQRKWITSTSGPNYCFEPLVVTFCSPQLKHSSIFSASVCTETQLIYVQEIGDKNKSLHVSTSASQLQISVLFKVQFLAQGYFEM